MAPGDGSFQAGDGVPRRFARLFWLAREVRAHPGQTVRELCARLGISRTQYYADKALLAECGFIFHSRPGQGFQVEADTLGLAHIMDGERAALFLVLSDARLLREGTLARQALAAARALGVCGEARIARLELAGMDTGDAGVARDVLEAILLAVAEGRVIRILYERSEDWSTRWREVYPRWLFSSEGFLYLYAKTRDEAPPLWKVFRLARVRQVEPTPLRFAAGTDDGDFAQKYRNVFMGCIGTELHPVRIRLRGVARHFVRSERVHHTQRLAEEPDGSLILSMRLPEPEAARWWAMKWGADAEVL